MKRLYQHKAFASIALLISALFIMQTFTCCDSSKGIKYMAVQLEKGDDWSIIDEDGNVVVKEEYDKDDIVSMVYENDVFWVKSNKKYNLYSIDSPKKSLNKEEYDAVTDFNDNRAFVVVEGKPIQLIDSDGKLIKELPKNIIKAHGFSDGLAPYMNPKGKYGYLNTNGEIAIDAKFYYTGGFADGFAVVQKKEDGNYLIINKTGETVSTINANKYEVKISAFIEGKLCCIDKKTDKTVFLNTNGEVVLTTRDKYVYAAFYDGYCITLTDDGYKAGVIDENGEKIIRTGKYDGIVNVGKGQFLVYKERERRGQDAKTMMLVDKDGEEIAELDYKDPDYDYVFDDHASNVEIYTLGDNIIAREGKYMILIDREGKPIEGECAEFHNKSCHIFPYGIFYNDMEDTEDTYEDEDDYLYEDSVAWAADSVCSYDYSDDYDVYEYADSAVEYYDME
jgi:hypothetical protein